MQSGVADEDLLYFNFSYALCHSCLTIILVLLIFATCLLSMTTWALIYLIRPTADCIDLMGRSL